MPLSIDTLREQTASWDQAVTRAERGETVPVIAHGRHVADVVPSDELDRLRETIEVLSDSDAMRALREAERSLAEGDVVRGPEAIRALLDERE